MPRGMAQVAKEQIDQAPGVHKDLFVPKHPTRIEAFEAIFAGLPSGKVGFVAGASYASLRRILIVDSHGTSIEDARRNAQRTLREVGLGALAKEPEHAEAFRHLRAAIILRKDPRKYVQIFGEAEIWPPSADTLTALERELEIAPSEATAIRQVPDRATHTALIKERALERTAPMLYVASDQVDEVTTLCAAGFLAPRWQLIGHGIRPATLAGLEDLKGPGGAYVPLKVLMPGRVGTFIQEGEAYVVVVSDIAFDRIERHIVDRDKYGSLAGIETGLSEEHLKSAFQNQTFSPEHEVLFPDGLPASLILGVICRTQEDEARLQQVLAGYRLRVRTVVSDRYISL